MIGERNGFTLIEVLVVVTLMAIAVGFTTVRLAGVTTMSRLESAVAQMRSIIRLTCNQARITGQPRLIEYAKGSDSLLVKAPALRGDDWAWDDGLTFLTVAGVQIERVLIEGDAPDRETLDAWSVRVGDDGRAPRHAVIVSLHGHYAALVHAGGSETRTVMFDHRPEAATYELLMLDVERTDAGKGP